jgi:hypothetical protein
MTRGQPMWVRLVRIMASDLPAAARFDYDVVEPDQQDLGIAVERRQRLGFNREQRLGRIAHDRRDLADRIAGRIDAAETRAHQQVADDDVSVLRQVGQ